MHQPNRHSSRAALLVIVAGAGMTLTACGKTEIVQTRGSGRLPIPDQIIVQNFAVTPEDVTLDRGVGARISRESSGVTQTEEEIRVGRAVAASLSKHLVKELRDKGINAVHEHEAMPPTARTVVVTGDFLHVDQGDRTKRSVVGFGLGGTEVRTRIRAFQNKKLVSEAHTVAKSGLKPGMLLTIPAGAAAGSAATAAAVSTGTTAASELFFSTVESDAKRTAKKVAKRIDTAYRRRGWK